jgi:Protein of unknown function (DUF4239)
MPNFLYLWPLWVVLVLLIGGFVVFSTVALGLVRRFLRGLQFTGHDAHFGGAMIHSMMVIYGLVAALIAVNVYETYSEVAKTVAREATAISALYRDASGYPEPTHTWVQRAVRDYTLQIINEAWPQQRRGQIPSHGVVMVNQIQQALFSFEPKTEGQKIIHAEALRAFNEMALARRLRVDANRERLPGVMWRLLIFGAMLCLFAACFFRVDSPGLHRLTLSLLATLMALVLFMIFVWDRPYVGEFGIDSDAYRLIYEQLMHS